MLVGGGPDGGRIAGTVTSKWEKGSGGPAGDEVMNLIGFGSKDYWQDAAVDVSPTVRSGEHGEGVRANAGVPPAVAFSIQAGALRENPESGPDGVGVQADHAYTLEARAEVQAVAFAQNTRDEVRLIGGDGQVVGALGSELGMKQQAYLAEPVGFDMRGRDGVNMPEGPHDTASIRAASGGSSRTYFAAAWQVRRLMPVECERLQGFPDGHTDVPYRRRNWTPDGPRYRVLGNSWPVNTAEFIGERIDEVARWDGWV